MKQRASYRPSSTGCRTGTCAAVGTATGRAGSTPTKKTHTPRSTKRWLLLSKLAAPFVPFMAEEIYLNLVTRPFGKLEPESVHLCDHPRAEESHIDRALSDEMAMVRNIVSLGLRVRTDHRLKVRQPLSEAEVVFAGFRAAGNAASLRPTYRRRIERAPSGVRPWRHGARPLRCTAELPTARAAAGQEDAVSEASVRLRRCSRPAKRLAVEGSGRD